MYTINKEEEFQMSKATTNTSDKFKDLIGPTDPAIDREAREKLIGARVSLLIKQPFFGNLATRMMLINADEWCATLATDAKHFYYNSKFVMMLDQKEIEFGFGHEILHCCYEHLGRRDSRDARIFNYACDYCVNNDLVNHGIGRKITTIDILYDRKYDKMSAEEVYDLLLENAEQINLDDLLEKMLDDHLDGEGESSDSGSEGKGRPKMTQEERDAAKDEFKEAVLNAAGQSEAGKIPAGVKKMLKDLTEPQMDWRELLNLQLTSAIRNDYTWMRPSRKSWHMQSIIPGMNPGESIDIAVAIDTSGSINERMLRDFLGEVKGAMESFTSYKIHLYCFDTQVHNPQEFTSDDITDIEDYELGGFGGTDFVPIFDHLKENDIQPERLVVFTDLEPWGSFGDENYCDTLWINHSNPGKEAPFGMTVDYVREK